jgi:hypothetical protein
MNSKPIPDLEEAERRQWTLPEEDLPPCITARRQPGEHRWFRSPNIIPIEQWRQKEAQGKRTLPDGSRA